MQETPIQQFFRLFKQDYAIPALFISLVALVLGHMINVAPIALIGAIGLFSAFDAIGFWLVCDRSKEDNKLEYRMIQVTMQILICAYIGWPLFVLFLLIWVGGFCDVLFYWLLKQWEYIKYEDMFWAWWTILGFFGKVNGKQLTIVSSIVAVIGLTIAFFI